MDFLNNDVINIATAVIAVASAVANVTKTDKDNTVISVLSKIVNFFALNWRLK